MSDRGVGRPPTGDSFLPQVVLASGNQGKLRELRVILEPAGCSVRALSEFTATNAVESGATFVENAILKARHACIHSGLPALADDSGLMVNALEGGPGVRSARYAGDTASDADNRAKLLRALEEVEPDKRQAQFVSVVAYLRDERDPLPVVFTGFWHGTILSTEQGDKGFGYDSLFGLEDGRSAAELEPGEKNERSHRGLALRQLLKTAPWANS